VTANPALGRATAAARIGRTGERLKMRAPLKDRPDLDRLIIEAQRRYDAMTPEQKKVMRDQQRRSWVIGNYMLDHPEATREEAEEIYQKVVEGVGL
jgi:hypothetical protein